MCIPCVANPVALDILAVLLLIAAGLLFSIALFLRKAGPVLLIAAVGLWRYTTGAVLRKDLGARDADYWATAKRNPRYTRGVRATARLAPFALLVIWATLPALFTAITAIGAGATFAAGLAYLNRRRAAQLAGPARPAVGAPIRVRAKIGASR